MSNNNQVVNGLLGKIFAVFTSEDTITPSSTKEDMPFISYCQPGIPVAKKDLKFGDMSKPEQIHAQALFSQLCNSIPKTEGFWATSSAKIWEVYDEVLRNKVLPDTKLSAEEQKALEKANALLLREIPDEDDDGNPITRFVPSPKVKAYSSYSQKYSSLLQKYNSLLIEASDPDATPQAIKNFHLNGPIVKNEVTQAWEAWQGEGYKGQIENARGLIATITNRGYDVLFSRRMQEFESSKRSDHQQISFYPTFFYPTDLFDGDITWTEITYAEQEAHKYSEKNSTSWGGGASASYGLWSFSTDASHSKGAEQSKSNTRNLQVKFEVVQIPLVRPWFDGSILRSRAWKWKGNRTEFISTGGDKPTGLMPAVPTSIILAKNLEIKMDMSTEENKSAFSKLSTSASGGWGPFRIKGNYSTEKGSSSHDFQATQSGLKCSGMQILGFICEKLPKTPNPDPGIKFLE